MSRLLIVPNLLACWHEFTEFFWPEGPRAHRRAGRRQLDHQLHAQWQQLVERQRRLEQGKSRLAKRERRAQQLRERIENLVKREAEGEAYELALLHDAELLKLEHTRKKLARQEKRYQRRLQAFQQLKDERAGV